MTCAEATRSFAPVRAAWRELLERLPWSTIFMTPEWQEAWWDEFGRDDELRLVIVGPPDAPLGLAPMQLSGGRVTFVGGTDLFDYHDFRRAGPRVLLRTVRLPGERAVERDGAVVCTGVVANLHPAAAGSPRARLRCHGRGGGRGARRGGCRSRGTHTSRACGRRTGTN